MYSTFFDCFALVSSRQFPSYSPTYFQYSFPKNSTRMAEHVCRKHASKYYENNLIHIELLAHLKTSMRGKNSKYGVEFRWGWKNFGSNFSIFVRFGRILLSEGNWLNEIMNNPSSGNIFMGWKVDATNHQFARDKMTSCIYSFHAPFRFNHVSSRNCKQKDRLISKYFLPSSFTINDLKTFQFFPHFLNFPSDVFSFE